MALPATPMKVEIFEVGPRDGLQNISTHVATATKVELINRLQATGLQKIEITSAVSPKAIPQLADNELVLSSDIVRNLLDRSSLDLPVLVANRKGLTIARKHNVREVAVFVSATEGFSKANIKCSVEEGLARAREVAQTCMETGVKVRGYISCIFADPYDGSTTKEAVAYGVRQLLEMGCYQVSLGDTLGAGVASDVERLLSYLFQDGIPVAKLAVHFHDTYGQGVSNAWIAFKQGIRTFDASVAGLGGCPFAPGAKGNVATEDLVYLFEQAGIQTGVDLRLLSQVGSWISQQIGVPNQSRAGVALLSGWKTYTAPGVPKSERFQWRTYKDLNGLEILRSGRNIKIVLKKPENGNALTHLMVLTLTGFFKQLVSDRTVARVVITGSGRFFCTGMDLGSDTAVAKGGKTSDDQFELLTELFEAIYSAPQVTIAALNGPAFGGGVGLAFSCDIRMGLRTATATLSETKLGLCAATISKHIIREWGPALTREAMLSARPVTLSQLHSLGVVAVVVDDAEALDTAIDVYLQRLRGAAPRASTISKELVKLGCENSTQQDKGIRAAFDEMMRPGGESIYGLQEFKARRAVDWDTYTSESMKSKL